MMIKHSKYIAKLEEIDCSRGRMLINFRRGKLYESTPGLVFDHGKKVLEGVMTGHFDRKFMKRKIEFSEKIGEIKIPQNLAYVVIHTISFPTNNKNGFMPNEESEIISLTKAVSKKDIRKSEVGINWNDELKFFKTMSYYSGMADDSAREILESDSCKRGYRKELTLIGESHKKISILKNTLYRLNIGLVHNFIARKWINPTDEETKADAFEALYRSIIGFNPEIGTRFSTYACNAIKKSITFNHKLKGKWKHRSLDDYCEGENLNKYKTMNARELDIDEINTILETNSSELNDTELYILTERYGLGGVSVKTLKEIGEVVGVCKERIRQIQRGAENKIRKANEELIEKGRAVD